MVVQSLGWEDTLEESMAIHSSILAWRILAWDRGTWQAIVHRFTKSGTQLKQLSTQHIVVVQLLSCV